MIKTIKLKNFRKHTDSEFNFTSGFNCVRGENECGKTTLLESILYAMFGTKALRDSLAETVTYDQPEGSLKVVLSLTIDGVDYTVTRSKSGAEVVYADQIVTGQTETRSFFERLLGCTTDLACKLMFADQNSVRGVLEEGGTAANALVETLAELNVIEELIDKVSEQLPTGNTSVIDAKIANLENNLLVVPAEPTKDELNRLNTDLNDIQAKTEALKQSMPAQSKVVEAKGAIEAANAAKAVLVRFRQRKVELEAELAKPLAKLPFSEEDLAQVRVEAANDAEAARRVKAYGVKFPTCEGTWDGTLDSAKEFFTAQQEIASKASQDRLALVVALNTAKMKKINEKNCAFCKKDLSEVPEVVQLNLAADEEIKSLLAKEKELLKIIEEASDNVSTIKVILATTEKIEALAGDYWNLDYAQLPPTPVWKGEPPVAGDAAARLQRMEAELRVYQEAVATRNKLVDELAAMCVEPAVQDVEAEKALLQQVEDLKVAIQQSELAVMQARAAVQAEQVRIDAVMAEIANVRAMVERSAKELEELRQARAAMLVHNELVKKLRAARPQIAAQMWGTVLGAISHYFTKIRGESSVVTRDAQGFKVNGKGVKGLSGSTLDALGLAIRMSLSKLFLPNVGMLFLDESFAGCSDTRELNGVGTLVSSGFEQVILVTHSSLPEAAADNLVEI